MNIFMLGDQFGGGRDVLDHFGEVGDSFFRVVGVEGAEICLVGFLSVRGEWFIGSLRYAVIDRFQDERGEFGFFAGHGFVDDGIFFPRANVSLESKNESVLFKKVFVQRGVECCARSA